MFATTELLAQSSFFQLAERIDSDLLGAIAMVSSILFFLVMTISIVTITRTVQNITLAKMQNQLLNELLAKGYSVDEIHQLVTGKRRSVLTRAFDRGRQAYVSRRPAPPVKPTSV